MVLALEEGKGGGRAPVKCRERYEVKQRRERVVTGQVVAANCQCWIEGVFWSERYPDWLQ